jgi:hypothetical protein
MNNYLIRKRLEGERERWVEGQKPHYEVIVSHEEKVWACRAALIAFEAGEMPKTKAEIVEFLRPRCQVSDEFLEYIADIVLIPESPEKEKI